MSKFDTVPHGPFVHCTAWPTTSPAQILADARRREEESRAPRAVLRRRPDGTQVRFDPPSHP